MKTLTRHMVWTHEDTCNPKAPTAMVGVSRGVPSSYPNSVGEKRITYRVADLTRAVTNGDSRVQHEEATQRSGPTNGIRNQGGNGKHKAKHTSLVWALSKFPIGDVPISTLSTNFSQLST